jgi:alpha-L-rhamnosidase
MPNSFSKAFLGICTLLLLGHQSVFGIAVDQLTTNGRANPLGIGAGDISFGWTATSSQRGTNQQAYQIRVGTSAASQDVWDSGQVQSARQVDVTLPSSIHLQPATRYYWQVLVWDTQGQASAWSNAVWFETGLLAESDWSGAAWITRPNNASPNPAAWTNYTATVDFTLQSQAFGVFLRSSTDAQNAYMFQINVTGTTPVFKPHKRVGGTYTVLGTVNLSPFGYTNATLTGTKNTLQFVMSGSTITTKLNGVTIDTRTDSTFASGLVGFRTDGAEAGLVSRVQVVDSASGTTLINPDFSKGENGFSGGFIANNALNLAGSIDSVFANLPPSLPLLRGKFVARAGIASARVYASAQGLYEVSINGQKAGDQFLAPGWTDYNARIQSQTYDVTNLVQSGTNVIGAALADGWYRGSVGIDWTGVYGNQLAFVAKIKVTYTDGSSDWFSTGTSWKASDGPYAQGDLQDGESYNANFAQPGWNTTTFDDSSWLTSATATNVSARLIPQPDEPIRMVTTRTAQSRTEILPQTWIYDLGQNMVGVPKVLLSGTKGQTITLRHGEDIYRTGTQTGQLYTANLRTAKATDTYTFAVSGTVTYQPTFTQHGFRYIEITGVTSPPAAADVQGVVLSSDLPDVGDLNTSNSLLNQLVSNIRWGQRSNFLSIPTDTPARDERLGWTGDINVFAPAAARYKDTRAFLSKWMTDVRGAQKTNGNIPAVVPQPLNNFDDTGVGWADAFITIPYAVWRATGDERILRENWTAMKAFYQFVHDSATGDGDLLEQGRSSWFSGDWLSLETNWNRLEEHKVIGTAYFAEDTRMMAEMAVVMGETNQAAQWSALVPQIRAAFVSAYRGTDGSIYQGTQTAYAMALGMNMIADSDQRQQTAGKFIQKLAADSNHLRTGFLGTPWLLPALTKMGRNDLAMQLLLNQDYPSWGFPITMGATTMWERWNSINPDGTFGPVDMNSFNHYAYGAVGDWMFGNLGGIQALEPGYKTSRIAPLIGYGGLTSATCSQVTTFGRLATAWSISSGTAVLNVEIPVNTTSEVWLPASDGATVYEGSVPAKNASGVQFLRTENGATVWSAGSGSYAFSWAQQVVVTGLMATPGNAQVSLAWQPAANAASYNVKRSLVSGGPYTTITTGITGTAYSDGGVTNGAAYYYVVSGVGPAGEGGNSSEVSATPNAATISVPNFGFETPVTTTFAYNPTGGSWAFSGAAGNGSGVTTNGSGFTSSNAAAPQGTQVAFLQRTGTISQTLSGFAPGGVYTITFSAANRATSGYNGTQSWDVRIDGVTKASFSNKPTTYADYTATFTASATSHTLSMVGTGGSDTTVFIDNIRITGATLPAPTGLGATTVSSSQINLTWSASSGATGYSLKRSTSSGGPYTQVANVTGTSCADTASLATGTPYYYVVSAINPVGAGANSSEASATTFTTVQQWRLQNFGTTSNTGNAADTADPDGDGLSNLVECAIGSDPNVSNTAAAPQVGVSGGKLTLSFTRNTAATDVTLRVTGTDDLTGSWTELARSTGGAAFSVITSGATVLESGTGALRNVQVGDVFSTHDPAHPKRFLRLKVEH